MFTMKATIIAIICLALALQAGADFCTGKPDNFYADPSTGCQTFYQCVNGAGVSQSCGPGTKFDNACKCCNYAAQVQCSGGPTTPTTPSTTPAPSAPTSPSGGSSGCKITYTVKSGDTLSNIASSQGTTVQAIQAANPSITDPNKISVGQQICIPGTSSPGTPTMTPAPSTPSGGNLYSGSGSGTYYYDVKTTCPQDTSGYPETNGYPACASYTPGPDQQTLKQIGSNNIVAMDMNVLKNNRAGLCGKQIIVLHNGVKVNAPDGGDFYVWDGCAACVGGVRIDFSVSGLRNVESDGCEKGVVPGVTWTVTNTQIKKFVA